MADPVLITCPKDVWTKVADNVTTGQIHKKKPDQVTYLATYRMSGNPAPDNINDKKEGVQIFVDRKTGEDISSSAAIDVYVMPVIQDAQVRVDL